MKRFLMLTATVLLTGVAWAGAPCPTTSQLYCGRSCERDNALCEQRCSNFQTAGATDSCSLECQTELDSCYDSCAGLCRPY